MLHSYSKIYQNAKTSHSLFFSLNPDNKSANIHIGMITIDIQRCKEIYFYKDRIKKDSLQ